MQYLIKTTTHDTGEVFHDVVKARENEVFTLVNAESEEEALEKLQDRYCLYNYDNQICTGTFDDVTFMMKILGRQWKNDGIEFELEIRKDSE